MAEAPVSRWRIVAAFAAVYLIWGSTYLAIRFAIETIPPFLMAGARFFTAGAMLYAWTRARGDRGRLEAAHWRSAAVMGALLLLVGNGGVTWAEQRIPSGIAALIVAAVPLWMVVLDWVRPGGARPAPRVLPGLAVGSVGLAILVGPVPLLGEERVDTLGVVVVILATLGWAAGSIYGRSARSAASPLLATAMQMLLGGAFLLLLGIGSGELGGWGVGEVSTRSLLAFVYLTLFGSLVAFSAYIWLLGVTSAARVATYAYVNPVVAVFLGWALAGEPIGPRTLLAMTVILGGVVLITTGRARAPVPVRPVGLPAGDPPGLPTGESVAPDSPRARSGR